MGKIIETSHNVPDINDINKFVLSYTGYINQVPPIYSAKKINGARAYALARAGGKPDMKNKSKIIVRIKAIPILETLSFFSFFQASLYNESDLCILTYNLLPFQETVVKTDIKSKNIIDKG